MVLLFLIMLIVFCGHLNSTWPNDNFLPLYCFVFIRFRLFSDHLDSTWPNDSLLPWYCFVFAMVSASCGQLNSNYLLPWVPYMS